ncbi:MAG: Endonuclease/Exonuclease/phosphatase family, partial [Deltaproteobacteria bacterium]|nr:Endonuclease/Exonuclease/phosphatase family [Deltaproteobacteria bacterium]
DVQVREAFALIKELDAAAIGLQEITDPARFTSEVRSWLGDTWRFVYQDAKAGESGRKLHIGALYDTRVFELVKVTSRLETRIEDLTQPTLQVDLRERSSGRTVTMLVIHFKALPAGRELRIRQFSGLLSILLDVESRASSVVVMGDFNATEPGDRSDLARISELAGMVWATEALSCSAYWERPDDCPTSRLDHILTWKHPTSVRARGGCEAGCDLQDRCPIYREAVSDHCPVEVVIDDLRGP